MLWSNKISYRLNSKCTNVSITSIVINLSGEYYAEWMHFSHSLSLSLSLSLFLSLFLLIPTARKESGLRSVSISRGRWGQGSEGVHQNYSPRFFLLSSTASSTSSVPSCLYEHRLLESIKSLSTNGILLKKITYSKKNNKFILLQEKVYVCFFCLLWNKTLSTW